MDSPFCPGMWEHVKLATKNSRHHPQKRIIRFDPYGIFNPMTTRVVRRAINRAMEMNGGEFSSLVKQAANKQKKSRRHGGGEGRGLATASGGRGSGGRDDIPPPPPHRRLHSQRQKRQHRGQQPPRQMTILSDEFHNIFMPSCAERRRTKSTTRCVRVPRLLTCVRERRRKRRNATITMM